MLLIQSQHTLAAATTISQPGHLDMTTHTSTARLRSPFVRPTLYVFNAAFIAKLHAIEQLTAEITGYNVDIAVISESHLKKKHADSCVSIDGCLVSA